MWALCDLAMHIIDAKVGQCDGNSSAFSMPLALPDMYYKLPATANFQNNEIYIPLDVYTLGVKGVKASASTSKASSATATKRTAELAILDDENSQVSCTLNHFKNVMLMFPFLFIGEQPF